MIKDIKYNHGVMPSTQDWGVVQSGYDSKTVISFLFPQPGSLCLCTKQSWFPVFFRLVCLAFANALSVQAAMHDSLFFAINCDVLLEESITCDQNNSHFGLNRV